MIQFSEPEQMNTAGRGAPGRTGVLWPQGDQQRTVSWVTVTYGFKLQQTPEVLASSTRQWLPECPAKEETQTTPSYSEWSGCFYTDV